MRKFHWRYEKKKAHSTFIRNGCILLREGGRHSIWKNENNGEMTSVPRHNEIKDFMAHKICKDLAIREYEANDYQACEDLVGRTWRFSEHFHPSGFCDVAKYAYTRGSVASSNFKKVVESDGQVVGFLFGCNNQQSLDVGIIRRLMVSFAVLSRLLFVRQMRLSEKFAFLDALNRHEVNRSKVEQRGASEINLFALEQGFQRQGLGRQLVTLFLDDCKEHGVRRVIVEANIAQASGFYEKCGFAKIQDFVSPLHEIAAGKGSLAALYERRLPT